MGYFRHPKTLAEKKANQDGFARAARCGRNLPDTYDDIIVAVREDRSWKRFRRTRWKAKKN